MPYVLRIFHRRKNPFLLHKKLACAPIFCDKNNTSSEMFETAQTVPNLNDIN